MAIQAPTPNLVNVNGPQRPNVVRFPEETCDPITGVERPMFVLEKHITSIKKGPNMPLNLEMFAYTEERANIAGVLGDNVGIFKIDYTGDLMAQSSNYCQQAPCMSAWAPNTVGRAADGTDISDFYNPDLEPKKVGDEIIIPINWQLMEFDVFNDDTITITHEWTTIIGGTKKSTIIVQLLNKSLLALPFQDGGGNPIAQYNAGYYHDPMGAATINLHGKIMGTSGPMPPIDAITVNDIYTVTILQKQPFFEFKFPKFSYRYKYEDGEYSVFAPWSELAFIPSKFDYEPKNAYNLGMTNNIRSIILTDWRPKNMPKDVVEIDILYKESNSPNIYTVESFTKESPEWNSHSGIGGVHTGHFGEYQITSELIHKVVESNQLLRPWDNLPRRALAQDVTANRLIYANYTEGYDVLDIKGDLIKPDFSPSIDTLDFSTLGPAPDVKQPAKSLKSMRTYQLGVVYRDRYGRETPVLTSQSGSLKIEADQARLQNTLSVKLNSNPPYWAESYTFYIKETANEYYNLAMDRWYDAEDGGIWMSFPSSERNKIMDDDESSGQGSTRSSFIILKKQHDSDVPTNDGTKYKITSVKNNAPEFIKTNIQYWGSLPMMDPPPGWGVNGKVGDQISGMFATTGLPLPGRLYLDIYAEYWDQSVLHGLTNDNDAQVRVTQSAGQASAYAGAVTVANQKSSWYDVTSITYIGSPQQSYTQTVEIPYGSQIMVEQEVEFPGQPEQLVRITLKKAFGMDAAFCEPPAGSILSLNKGLSLEARTKITKNRAEFEGRFFVKINRDFIIEENIVKPQLQTADFMQVLQSKDIKYICAAHPGMQDWNDKSKGWSTGSTNLNASFTDGMYIPPTYDVDDVISSNIPGTLSGAGHAPIEVSSLSPLHANKGATWVTTTGGLGQAPQPTAPLWPFGPGRDSDGVFNASAFWRTKFQDFLEGGPAFKYFPRWSETAHDWPAFPISQYNPFSCNYCGSGGVTDTLNQALQPNLTGQYLYMLSNPASVAGVPMGGGATSQNGVLDLSECHFINGLSTIGGSSVIAPGKWDPDEPDAYMPATNPYQFPAIWGDASDLVRSITSDAAAPIFATPRPKWVSSTQSKLASDWYHLYYGNTKVDNSWPKATLDNQRWFIDKCGAAEGYSGNGIWDDGSYGYMDVSYYGIGNINADFRAHILTDHQESELGFATAMSTVGTQFRFKQDPDQIVYTITNVEENLDIQNYEGYYGYWGNETDPDNQAGDCFSGGGIGKSQCPPWGSIRPGPGSIADRRAFVSDLFSKNRSTNGSAPWNYRIRFTLTLDKIIGTEGAHQFHPILNHVDENGISNIKGGAKEYSVGFPHITENKGGTPAGLKFFNLSSYWNASVAPTTDQTSTLATGQHIGLHERGLNDTTIEVVTPYKGEDDVLPMSENPAIWETEPMEDVGLDIYYAASPSYPVSIERHRSDEDKPDPTDFHLDGSPSFAHEYDYSYRGEEVIKKGSIAYIDNSPTPTQAKVCGIQGNTIFFDQAIKLDANGDDILAAPGDTIKFIWKGSGSWYGSGNDEVYIETIIFEGITETVVKINPNTHNVKRNLSYFNCYSFANGVESNRIRDDYNAVTIDKGVKASMPLAEQYTEEEKQSSLIFSGIYNSTSGINRLNQFIQAEPITKDLNPINGSIQKLFARDTDLISFCENKVFKILAKKDALFNADGNTNVTSNAAVLGQTIPFSGEYGISTNPESFAQDSYRLYFADKTRGAVLRLSKDGLTPISDYGMKDWFRDNLRYANSIIGSFDDRDDQYNITIETQDENEVESAYTLSYTEKSRGWVSFKSFITQGGISHNNIYYTFPNNNYSKNSFNDPWGVNYGVAAKYRAELWQHGLDRSIERSILSNVTGSKVIEISSAGNNLIEGMTVIAPSGIPIDTEIEVMNNDSDKVTISKEVNMFTNNILTFQTPRNSFYGIDHYSMVRVLHNTDQNITIKRFKTLDYEGTQARVIGDAVGTALKLHNSNTSATVSYNQEYYDNYAKLGWYVHDIKTDSQEGVIKEFINKENKWFNYIQGKIDAGIGDEVDTSEFTLQGLGTNASS